MKIEEPQEITETAAAVVENLFPLKLKKFYVVNAKNLKCGVQEMEKQKFRTFYCYSLAKSQIV